MLEALQGTGALILGLCLYGFVIHLDKMIHKWQMLLNLAKLKGNRHWVETVQRITSFKNDQQL